MCQSPKHVILTSEIWFLSPNYSRNFVKYTITGETGQGHDLGTICETIKKPLSKQLFLSCFSVKCPDGWDGYQGTGLCYNTASEGEPYLAGRASCVAEGAFLPSPQYDGERQFLAGLFPAGTYIKVEGTTLDAGGTGKCSACTCSSSFSGGHNTKSQLWDNVSVSAGLFSAQSVSKS